MAEPTDDLFRANEPDGEFKKPFVPKSPTEAIQPVTPPPPPPVAERRRRPLVNVLSGFLSLIMVVALIAGGALFMGRTEFYAPGPLAADKIVVVKGSSGDVADQLAKEGVIDHPSLFLAGLHLMRKASQLKAGEYVFRQHASLGDVMDTLVEGKSVLHSVTIPEGLTSQQIVDRLNENDILTGEISGLPKEGTLLPDTYKIARGMTRQQLIDRMQQDQARVLREVWSRRSNEVALKTPNDLLTLASIVEKETGRADERTRVAAVFLNRLGRNMKLQSDPTIVYGLVQGKGTLGRGILRSEIEQPTPYNTYVIQGLPPGPIANPGRAALEAVANPSRTKELYFVADGTGGHVFAETLDQHNRNVGRWRQLEADRKEAAVDAAPAAAKDGPAAPDGAPNGAPAAAGAVGPLKPGAKPPTKPGAAPTAPGLPPSASALAPAGPRGNLDAVAGTPKDPLANKTFDLNSPKQVPTLRP